MKIVNILGGIGNQMFQYALGVALQAKYPVETVKIDIEHFNGYGLHNGFEINDVFPNAPLPIASAWDVMKISYYMPKYNISRAIRKYFPVRKTEYIQSRTGGAHVYYADALEQKGSKYFEGYWQSWKYFVGYEEEIRKAFYMDVKDEANLAFANKLHENGAVAMHVRRGDYVGHKVFGGICTTEYYINAIKKTKEIVGDTKFYILSNDIEWCEANLKDAIGDSPVEFVSINRGKDSYKDMWLLSQAANLIIANSSFSWWGAWLNNQGGLVCCPEKWTNRDYYSEDVIMPTWNRIKIK